MQAYTILRIVETCKGLISLNLKFFSECEETDEIPVVNDDLMFEIARSDIKLTSLIFGSEAITDASIVEIAKHLTQLEHLDIKDAVSVTDYGVTKIFESCHRLESLVIPGYHTISDEAFSDLNINSLPNLKSLQLNSCKISDDVISAITLCCPKIINLHLDGCRGLTDDGIIEIAEKYRNLEILELGFCRMISDYSMMKIGECCKKIEILKLPGCILLTDKSLEKIGDNCKNLKTMDISECHNINSIGVRFLASKCLMLETLDLSKIRNVTFVTVESVLSSCQKLKEITIYGCNVSAIEVAQLEGLFCKNYRKVQIVDKVFGLRDGDSY
jgi:F-box/leucine-rich repeat protein 2/20